MELTRGEMYFVCRFLVIGEYSISSSVQLALDPIDSAVLILLDLHTYGLFDIELSIHEETKKAQKVLETSNQILNAHIRKGDIWDKAFDIDVSNNLRQLLNSNQKVNLELAKNLISSLLLEVTPKYEAHKGSVTFKELYKSKEFTLLNNIEKETFNKILLKDIGENKNHWPFLTKVHNEYCRMRLIYAHYLKYLYQKRYELNVKLHSLVSVEHDIYSAKSELMYYEYGLRELLSYVQSKGGEFYEQFCNRVYPPIKLV